MTVTEVHSRQEFNELLKKYPYVVIQAHATWCGPCKAMSPIFEKLASEWESASEKLIFLKFDTDEANDLAQELGIRSIPAFFTFRDGDLDEKLSGANPPALKKLIDELGEVAKGAL